MPSSAGRPARAAGDLGLSRGHFLASLASRSSTSWSWRSRAARGLIYQLLAVLALMSVLSWVIIALKGLTLVARRRRSHAFLNFFWNASA